MLALRWIPGSVIALVAGGFLLLIVAADGFRRSFGASENGPLPVLLAIAIAGALLASLIAPDVRWLLHATAVLVVALAIACVWMFRESPFLGTAGWLYLGAWLIFYWQTAWAAAPR